MSNRLKGLREKQATVLDKYDALIGKIEKEKRDLTPEERAQRDGFAAEALALGDDIKAEQDIEILRARSAVPLNGLDKTDRKFSRVYPLKNFKGDSAVERAERFGHFFMAVGLLDEHGRQNEKSVAWCEKNNIPIIKAQAEGVNSAGGYLVPEEFSSEIIVLRNEYGLARRELRSYPMGRDTMTVPKFLSGLTAYPVGEGIAITASQAAWTQVRLTAKKWGVLVLFSSELDEDAAVAIGDLLAGEIAYAFALSEDGCLFSGDGTSTYAGMTGLRTIFNAGIAGVLAGSVDAASGHDTMAEMDATDIARCMGALPQYVFERGTPKFYMSQTMWANVFERLIGASGGVTKDQASGRTIRQYNGYDVVITPAMLAPAAATTDTSDVTMWLFGDLAMAAAMGDRRGMNIARSTEYKFAEDQIALKGTERFDIVVHGAGDATTPGPIVAMMGE